jgi:hypothetical protein
MPFSPSHFLILSWLFYENEDFLIFQKILQNKQLLYKSFPASALKGCAIFSGLPLLHLGMMIEEVTFLDMQLKTTSSSSSPN